MSTKEKLEKELKEAQKRAEDIQAKLKELELKNKPKDITDIVKSFEDACKYKKVKPSDIFNDNDSVDEKAYKKLKFITNVLNEDYVFKMTPDEYRYYPWFYLNAGSGFVFDNSISGNTNAYASYAARLCFKNSKLAEHAGKFFLQEYRDFIL